jgi:hypothetical protein
VVLLGSLVCLLSLACADGGKRLIDPESSNPPGTPVIHRLTPTRTIVADTVRVEGSGFGAEAANGSVTFAGDSGRVTAGSLTWSDSTIIVLVPPAAVSGPVSVRSGAEEGAGKAFSVAPRLISYMNDLIPLLSKKGCIDCHSGPFGTNDLRLESVADILRGDSFNGPVVSRRNGPGSIIVRKVSANPPFGRRMPLGCTGACLTDEEALSISDWIDQGTREN